ncbi:peroxisomal targeting signal 2 receptor-like isoform X1 [Biomphalaria glabrata]|uniref:Peroxin-7 n=1 Tax=Biomphalaria glabrata TaxID=6526 RepID=A0A9U8ECH0_BIOGL|nr:peroxisomal targeting signal 2 receptor-like isoform X1 [Biomphalaria glabrata]
MNSSFRTKSRHGYSVKFSPYMHNRLACVSSQYYGIAGCGTLYVLDNQPNQIALTQIYEWNNGLFDVAWAENNENILVTAAGDGSLQVWDVTQQQGLLKIFKEHEKEVNSVDWSQTRNEQLILTGSWDTFVKLWDITQDKSLATFGGHSSIVYNVSWSPHVPGCFASCSGDHTLRVWDCKNPRSCAIIIPAHDEEVLASDWCKYNEYTLFSGSVDGSIKGWDIRNPMIPISYLQGHKYSVRRIRASPFNGAILASASYDFTVKLWNIQKQICLQTVENHSEFVYGLDFNLHIPGQMADCSWDELVHIYHTEPVF